MFEPIRAFQNRGTSRPSDLDRHLRPVPPWDLSSGTLDLEIGCGVGWHPITYAQAHPHRRLIAIEHTRAKFQSFVRRLDRHEMPANLWPVHADAVSWAAMNLPTMSVDRVFWLYPNPEPKAPNKRWLRSPFMHRVLELLKAHGEVRLATNERGYFLEALAFAEHVWNLELIYKTEFTSGSDFSPRTHFEKKYLSRGDTCYEAHWRKP